MNRKMSEIEKSAEDVMAAIASAMDTPHPVPGNIAFIWDNLGKLAKDVRDLSAHLRSGGGALAGD